MLSIFSCASWPLYLEKCLFKSSVQFLTRLFVSLISSYMSCLYILESNPYRSLCLQIFSPIQCVVFLFCLWIPFFLAAPQHVGSLLLWLGIEPTLPALKAQSLNHWTAREVLAVQKLLSLIRSHLFIFVLIFIMLGVESKKMLLRFVSEYLAYVFL